MAIEVSQQKKKKVKAPEGLDLFFQAMIFLFVLVVGGYFFMLHLNTQAEEIGREIEDEIARRKAAVPEREEMEDRARYHRHLIEDFQDIIDARYVMSPFFSPFEGSVHPSAEVFVLNIEPEERTVRVSGKGEDFVAVGQQFYALKAREFVEELSLSNLSTVREDEEVVAVEFTFDMQVEEELFVKDISEDD